MSQKKKMGDTKAARTTEPFAQRYRVGNEVSTKRSLLFQHKKQNECRKAKETKTWLQIHHPVTDIETAQYATDHKPTTHEMVAM